MESGIQGSFPSPVPRFESELSRLLAPLISHARIAWNSEAADTVAVPRYRTWATLRSRSGESPWNTMPVHSAAERDRPDRASGLLQGALQIPRPPA